MFDVGFWELVLVFGLGLIILGPERLPRVAAKVGRWVGQARRTANQLRRQLEMEIKLDDTPTYKRPKPPPTPKTSQASDAEPSVDPTTIDPTTVDLESDSLDPATADSPKDTVEEPISNEPSPPDKYGND